MRKQQTFKVNGRKVARAVIEKRKERWMRDYSSFKDYETPQKAFRTLEDEKLYSRPNSCAYM